MKYGGHIAMLKNILNHKKKLIVAVLLLALIGVSAYVLSNKKSTVKTTTEKTSEVSTKEDKKNEVKDNKNTDKKNETKTSDKKEDVKADEKKADTKTDETSTSTENTTSNNTSNSTSSTTTNNNANNTVSNSTSNNSTPAPCVPTYTTVTHPAVGHYEQREIMPAYNKPVYEERIVGGHTGRIYNNLDEFYNQDEDGNYSLKQVQVGTEYVPAEYDNVWVEDQPAYTTTESSGC